MRVLLSGLGGHMGAEVLRLAQTGYRDARVVAGVDPYIKEETAVPCARSFETACTDVDVIVDFSNHAGTRDLISFAVSHNLPLVLATTGQTEEEKQMIFAAAEKIPLFFAANYSLGIALLIELAKKTAAAMPEAEIEIIEMHHDRKMDAPSGTALAIADAIRTVRQKAMNVLGRSGYGKRTPEEIGIHAVRMGNIVGIHEVMIGTPNQTITLKHEAHSRALFAEGALAAGQFLIHQKPGLYDMKSLINMD